MMQGGLATSLVPGDEIVVTLAVVDSAGARQQMHARFGHDGQNLAGGAGLAFGKMAKLTEKAPVFDLQGYTNAIALGTAEGRLEADRIAGDYREALDEYASQTGTVSGTVQEQIQRAVFQYACGHFGVKEEDHEGPVLKQSQVFVKTPFRNGSGTEPGVWYLSLAPKWGH